MTRRLLAVHAHPDDESSKGAATYAHYVSAGAQVLVVSCTGGERGDVQNPALEPAAMAERDIAGLRRIEMAAAQRALGIQHRWLGYEDSGLPESPDEPLPANCFALIDLAISAEPLVRIIREFRPHVLVTYDETGGYPHPDHIRTHELSLYARDAAADPARYPEQGDPWRIPKLYYDRIFNGERVKAVYSAMLAQEHPGAAGMAEFVEWMSARPSIVTTQVAVGDYFEARDEALRAHASQVEPQSPFFFWPNDVMRSAWPYDDYQLVDSTVPTETPETDLFAGIEDTV